MAKSRGKKVSLNRASISAVFKSVGCELSEEAIDRIESAVRECCAVVSSRQESLGVERASECASLLKRSNRLCEEMVGIDSRNEHRLSCALGDNYSGNRKSRHKEGRDALRECKLLVEWFCSATLPAIDRANDETYKGKEPGDVAVRTLCRALWREWQQATGAKVIKASVRRKALDKQVDAARPFYQLVLSAAEIHLQDRIVGDLIRYSVTGRAPEKFY